ncbi:putative inorganic phosphate cotransporter [Danaus plexippus]|uniref:putative inorganic phosphate cotransporter n=1 Tax=Danaus plexippus TaxID=13037 RepID=UPI002AAFE849|nr:putative inorganic phosphate cotransporter [Danaus plexippus]
MTISDEVSNKNFGYGVRHIQIACMCLTIVALFIARASMGVAVLAMTDGSRDDIETYKWDKKTQGIILSSFFWGYTVMQIPAGILSKRYGGKSILLISLLTNTVICGLLPTLVKIWGWPIVCVCRVIMGLTQACLFPATHTLLGRWLPKQERTSYSGIVYGGTQIGIIIAMPISGLLADTKYGWKSIFYTVSATMLVTAGVWSFFAANMPREHRMMTEQEKHYIERGLNTVEAKALRTPWRHIFQTRALWAIMVTHIGSSVSFVLFFVDLPTYIERGLKISLKNSAVLSALPYLGMWIGNISSTYICEKIYNRNYWSLLTCRKVFNSISFFGLSIGLIVLAFLGPENKSLAIITLVMSLFLSGFSAAGFLMSFLDLSPNYAGVTLSLSNAAANFGSILTPIGTSLVLKNDPTDTSRWLIVFLSTALLCVIANCVFLMFASSTQVEWDDPNFIEKTVADKEEVIPALKTVKEDAER